MRDQRNIAELHVLAQALAQVLPEDSPGDPKYLSKSALAIYLAGSWQSDGLLASAIECAQRYWKGEATEQERASTRTEVVHHAESLRNASGRSSEWCRYALAMWALDVRTPSDSYGADYLLEAALDAGVLLESVRQALEVNVPLLSEAITKIASAGSSPTAR